MEIGSREWRLLLQEGAAALEMGVTDRQTDLFAVHARELVIWNQKVNLTAITDPKEMAVKHFLDSIVPGKWVPDGSDVLDIGSGAGFPGLPLKVMNPSLSLTLIDRTRKKVGFLGHVIRRMGLSDTTARHVRAEELVGEPRRFDVIVCRALSSLEDFIRLGLPLLRPEGRMIALKGRPTHEEMEAATQACGRRLAMTVTSYPLPILESHRSLVILDARSR